MKRPQRMRTRLDEISLSQFFSLWQGVCVCEGWKWTAGSYKTHIFSSHRGSEVLAGALEDHRDCSRNKKRFKQKKRRKTEKEEEETGEEWETNGRQEVMRCSVNEIACCWSSDLVRAEQVSAVKAHLVVQQVTRARSHSSVRERTRREGSGLALLLPHSKSCSSW